MPAHGGVYVVGTVGLCDRVATVASVEMSDGSARFHPVSAANLIEGLLTDVPPCVCVFEVIDQPVQCRRPDGEPRGLLTGDPEAMFGIGRDEGEGARNQWGYRGGPTQIHFSVNDEEGLGLSSMDVCPARGSSLPGHQDSAPPTDGFGCCHEWRDVPPRSLILRIEHHQVVVSPHVLSRRRVGRTCQMVTDHAQREGCRCCSQQASCRSDRASQPRSDNRDTEGECNTNRMQAGSHARSECAFSGLTDNDPERERYESRVQTAGDSWKYCGLDNGSVGTLGLCSRGRPNQGQMEDVPRQRALRRGRASTAHPH